MNFPRTGAKIPGKFPMAVGSAQAGISIVELMISITLGMFVILVAMALLLSSKSGYTAQNDVAVINENGRYVMETISRAVHQAAYENWDADEAPILASSEVSAHVSGFDARSLKSTTAGIDSPVAKSINGSDVLAIRFYGSGSGTRGDGTVLNCAGFGIPSPRSGATADEDRGWSIFYVAVDSAGEPEFRCKYFGKSSWSSAAIARGVESFQVLYGIDSDADGSPNQFMTATEIDTLDDTMPLAGNNNVERSADKNKKSNWKKVVVIRIGLLLRGTQNARSDAMTASYDLFGAAYGNAQGSADIGSRILEDAIPKPVRNRIRKIFSMTFQLRNSASAHDA